MLILSNYSICNGFLMFSLWSPKRKASCVSSNQLSTGQCRKMSWGNAFPGQSRGPRLQTARGRGGRLAFLPSLPRVSLYRQRQVGLCTKKLL